MPSLSIIIPVRNEHDRIIPCIESIFAMQGIDQAEVLVIDGMSCDGTREKLTQLASRFPSLTILDNPHKKVTTALNIGISNARGTIVMRLDAHALYAPDYITACLRVMEQTGAANVGGHAFALPGGTSMVAHAIALAHHSAFGLGGASFRSINAQGKVETVWPGCFTKQALNTAGPVNETLDRSEDIELNYRIRKAGFRIYLSSRIRLWYFCRPALAALFHQRFLDGRGVVQTLGVNAGAVRPRHLAPLAAAMLGVALLLGIGLGFVLNILWLLPVSASALAIAGCVWIMGALWFSVMAYQQADAINGHIPHVQHTIKKSAAALLLLVFATLHLSYGLGSLIGLGRVWKKKDGSHGPVLS